MNHEHLHVQRNEKSGACRLEHRDQPFRSADARVATLAVKQAANAAIRPTELAAHYLQDVAALFEIDAPMLSALDDEAEIHLTDATNQLRFQQQKELLGNVTVTYVQTVFGVPVWNSAIVVHMEQEPLQVT